MKKLLTLALLCAAISSLGHFYLANKAYEMEAGKVSSSRICNVSETINCDKALLSPYSRIFGVSLSDFGLSFNLLLSLLLLSFFLFGASTYWKNISVWLSGVVVLSSVAMAGISLIYKLYCPVCWGLYLLSFLTFIPLFFVFKKDLYSPLSFISQNLKEQTTYILGGGILLFSLFVHISFINSFDLKNKKELLEAVFIDWQNETPISLSSRPILEKGPKEARIVLSEFVDFLCPMCKRVQPAVAQFLSQYPHVKFQLYVYPLDGTCNPSVGSKQSGLSCELSKALICAQKQNKGWLAHDFIFEKQRSFLGAQGNKKEVKKRFEELTSQLQIHEGEFENCMKKTSTLGQVKQSSRAGKKAGIPGTPSFFMNGKSVRHYSSELLILRKIQDHLRKHE